MIYNLYLLIYMNMKVEKRCDLVQSNDKRPYTYRKFRKEKWKYKNVIENFITQRLE